MARMGPLARAKKMMDPEEYNRAVEQKMAQDGLTRQQAEAEYNQFLENPPFYYALDKKADCTCHRRIFISLDRIGWLAVVIFVSEAHIGTIIHLAICSHLSQCFTSHGFIYAQYGPNFSW